MPSLLPEAVGTGLVVGLIFGELFGITAGGMVVPGYIALSLIRPTRVAGTVGVAILVFLSVKLLSRFSLLYGRRRFAITILLGFFMGLALEHFLRADITGTHAEFRAVGFIIPGLLAGWMDHQGVTVTIAGLITVAVLTRLIMIAIFGSEIRI